MEQGNDLEQIARDPLAIFDWITGMVMELCTEGSGTCRKISSTIKRYL
ncbi:MAG: hypothetical protein IH934_06410 [Nanoarchaeota archaeon]|nr:hypothetical protein [Nanoarchaeota archaeon]